MHRLLFPAALAAAIFLADTAQAQNPPPMRVRGTIEKLDGQTLTVKARDGSTQQIKLNDGFTVTAVVKATLADVTLGKFVGIASLPQSDGTQRAIEVLVFPEAMRGSGEGHYPWDLQPDSMMTNATVAEIAGASNGPLLSLKYKDGEKKILVPPEAPVVTFESGDKSLLTPGTGVMVPAAKQADGSLAAGRVLAGKNGVIPPM